MLMRIDVLEKGCAHQTKFYVALNIHAKHKYLPRVIIHHRYFSNRSFSFYNKHGRNAKTIRQRNSMETPCPSSATTTLSWEVLILIGHHLDPKTLAIASCVSKSWSNSMSSNHLWKPIVTSHFPSLCNLPPVVSYRRRFALGHSAALRRRKTPSKPIISINDLIFAVSIISKRDSRVTAAVTTPCDALVADPHGVFRFGVGCENNGVEKSEGFEEMVKVTWNVVVKGWSGVFTVMDCEGKVGFVPGGEGWFSQELPVPSCCLKAVASSVVGDLKVGLCGCGEGKVRVEKVSVGILSVVDWRYLCIEDGLRYLQHFLLS